MVTVTFTVPRPAGMIAVIRVPESTLNTAGEDPKRVVAAPVKSVPLMMTVPPPGSGPAGWPSPVTVERGGR